MPRSKKSDSSSLLDHLLSVMRRLRGPGGCPWDRQQTHDSIKIFLLEEAYEALEAISGKKPESLREELGDLLFQIIFHAQMAEETGSFNIEDVIKGIIKKLENRHPHVFGNAVVRNAQEQTIHWDRLKSREKEKSLLDRVPKAMPALLQAFELQERAHRLGFKWNNIKEVQEKLKEELEEWCHACATGERENIEEELGDVLFMLTNISRWLKLNPEEALLKTNRKFRERFAYIEKVAAKRKIDIGDIPPEKLEKLWRTAKKKLKKLRGKNDGT